MLYIEKKELRFIFYLIMVLFITIFTLLFFFYNKDKHLVDNYLKHRLFSFENSNIVKIKFKSNNFFVNIEKIANKWFLVKENKKIEIKDKDFVDILLNDLSLLDNREYINSDDLKFYKLDKPILVLSIYSKYGKVYELFIGKCNIDCQKFYCQKDKDKKIYILPAYIINVFINDFNHLKGLIYKKEKQ